ncbi:MAG: FGGY family carbohydrate kinase [Candidatus Velthaea sp.]
MSAPAPLVFAIDQGTSATKCVLIDVGGAIVARASAPLGETHPRPGWVEQDADALWDSVLVAAQECLAGVDPAAIAGIGLSTQRESVAVWDRRSGRPLAPLISWQDQRTAAYCDALRTPHIEKIVRERSGLPLDPMFSAAKMHWLLDAVDPQRSKARGGELCFGTVDSWLLYRLTGAHLIEAGNASRTQLLDTARVAWDDELLALFDIPRAALPEIVPSSGPFPAVLDALPLPAGARVFGVLADSHAALFAHGVGAGSLKVTYGTGSSVMGLLPAPKTVGPGLCLTVAWQTRDVAFAAEGNIRSTGAALRWLADLLALTPQQLVELGSTAHSEGVAFVPSFSGLGAPWWDLDAAGLITGLTQKAGRAELARAALEAVVHQIADVVDAFGVEVAEPKELLADGGPTRSDALMQLQADVAGRPVLRAGDPELSALGAGHLAGAGAGLWSAQALDALPRRRDTFEPSGDAAARAGGRRVWSAAVARARFRPSVARPPATVLN